MEAAGDEDGAEAAAADLLAQLVVALEAVQAAQRAEAAAEPRQRQQGAAGRERRLEALPIVSHTASALRNAAKRMQVADR